MKKAGLLCTKVKLDSFVELRIRLNGKCGDTCPMDCIKNKNEYNKTNSERTLPRLKIMCNICFSEFNFLNTIWHLENNYELCPCHAQINKNDLFFRLDKYIEELQKQLKKEYSA